MRQDVRMDRINRLLNFFKPHRGRIRLMLECIGMDDSDTEVKHSLRLLKDTPIRRLVLRKCNFQEKKTQGFVFQDTIQLYIVDSFVKFWIKDTIKVKEIVVKKSTIIYGKSSVPVFEHAKKFVCTDSFVKNPEFAWRPMTESIEEMTLINNDYYGVLSFNIVYHIVFYMKKFQNLKKIEFEGQVDEETFIKLLTNIHYYKQLAYMRFINKGAFFNFKLVCNNTDVQSLRLLENGPNEVIKVNEDTSRIILKFTVPGESLERTVDFTFLNY